MTILLHCIILYNVRVFAANMGAIECDWGNYVQIGPTKQRIYGVFRGLNGCITKKVDNNIE